MPCGFHAREKKIGVGTPQDEGLASKNRARADPVSRERERVTGGGANKKSYSLHGSRVSLPTTQELHQTCRGRELVRRTS